MDRIYEKIIAFDTTFNYSLISKKTKANEIYHVEGEGIKLIMKIIKNKSEEEFVLISYVLKALNKNDFPTASLYYQKYDGKNIYLILEYIEGLKKIEYSREKNILITNMMKKFYKITEKFQCIDEKLNLIYHIKKFENEFSDMPELLTLAKKSINYIHNNYSLTTRLLLFDVNTSNFLESEIDSETYLVDFDDIIFGELEYDLADFFTDFDCYGDNLNQIIYTYADFLRQFKNEQFYIEKIMHYVILILIYDLKRETSNDRKKMLIEKIKCMYDNFENSVKTLKNTLHTI